MTDHRPKKSTRFLAFTGMLKRIIYAIIALPVFVSIVLAGSIVMLSLWVIDGEGK